jgi:predicted flap endonuclease-1-like 5' DNA nuclease
MFKEWDFLLAEIWVLLALAALIGLIAGWLIWGGRSDVADVGPDADEVRRLRAELDRANAQGRARLGDPLDDVPEMQGGGYSRPVQPSSPVTTATPATEPKPVEVSVPTPAPSTANSTQPEALPEPRDGLPDDLTKIKGIGAKMEKLCNSLGFYHYDQIAGWSAQEIAWVDDNLEGFKGRVTRDGWVEQARAFAKNQTPAFVRRKD